jgi:putative DNA modification/repair radical SAM protein
VDLAGKLAVLSDAARYDVSCAAGDSRRTSSLLKILLTNYCIHNCAYCVSRVSADPPRMAFTPDEVAAVTMDHFRRGMATGLFLSSGVIRNAVYTMEQMIEAARLLREEHAFTGYIHLKAVPGAPAELLERASRVADRVSANIELPRESDLVQLAPTRSHAEAESAMQAIREARPRAGQTTQMMVGATTASDQEILGKASDLYGRYALRRVYYSAFVPLENAVAVTPKLREHRLYQADWLLRLYGFAPGEIVAGKDGNLSLDHDPKLAWALAHREFFPVDVNEASREALLRVPGLGVKNADRILKIRRFHRLSWEDLRRLRVSTRKAMPFLQGWDMDSGKLAAQLIQPVQLELFETGVSVATGEL